MPPGSGAGYVSKTGPLVARTVWNDPNVVERGLPNRGLTLDGGLRPFHPAV